MVSFPGQGVPPLSLLVSHGRNWHCVIMWLRTPHVPLPPPLWGPVHSRSRFGWKSPRDGSHGPPTTLAGSSASVETRFSAETAGTEPNARGLPKGVPACVLRGLSERTCEPP